MLTHGALAFRQSAHATLQRLGSRQFWHDQQAVLWGYCFALLGVAASSLAIALVERMVHISNISLLYLLVVLALAAWVGRGPALLAAVLSFLAYDYLFIPPLYRLTVDDPTEWLSLAALLVTSLVTGQLASTMRDRAHEASQSQKRTAMLYDLAQVIASATDQPSLFNDLVQRLLKVFTPSGVSGIAILLPSQGIYPTLQALATGPEADVEQRALQITAQNYAAEAAWALEHGTVVGDTLGKAHAESLGAPRGQGSVDGEGHVYFIPLQSGQRTVGLLAMTGKSTVRSLLASLPSTSRTMSGGVAPQRALFAACCDQIALAIDRAALQQQAVHAEALHESNQLKDVFLGSVTHDLRTPLAAIKAAATSLLSADVAWSTGESREFLESINESADQLNRLVGNLLDISRQEAGVATPQKDWILIGDVIVRVLDQLELSGLLQGRAVQVDVADDIPLIPMDHTQIAQVITNLLENALKYSPADRPVRITAALTDDFPNELEVRVSDQGIGVPPSELHAIFNKFYRVQHVHLPWATDRPPTGTGLGLAISDNIIRAHDGRIWAESTPGKGSTFIFRLPIPSDMPQGSLPEIILDQLPDEILDEMQTPDDGSQAVSAAGDKPRVER
ncbi:MAG TPA: ATP-binding protein [Ktedonobacterales bacterium]